MGKGYSEVSALRGHGYGGHWGPCGGAVTEIAGTAQRGQLLGVGTMVALGWISLVPRGGMTMIMVVMEITVVPSGSAVVKITIAP